MRSGLRQLQQSGRIGGAEVMAADRWLRSYEFGIHGAPDPDRRGGSGGPEAWMSARLDALTHYRTASKAVGMWGHSLLLAFVAEGLSLRAAAAKIGVPHHDLAGGVVAVLARLAEHYHDIDLARAVRKSTQTVPYLPEREPPSHASAYD